MRAYLIGYSNSVIVDGYIADLINQDKCEAMQDESLDVVYVPIDRVLEIIGKNKATCKDMNNDFDEGYYTACDHIEFAIKKLQEGEQE